MLPPEERMRILLAESQMLEDYLTTLPKGAWTHPTACSEWCVADVVAHLTMVSQNGASRILRAIQGDASADDLNPRRRRGTVDPVGGAQRTIAFRTQFGEPDAILPEFVAASRQFNEALLKVGPDDWNKASYRPAGPEPISNMLDVVLAEQAVHGWDIRSQFDANTALSPDAVPVLVERIAQRPRWWSFKKGAAPLPLRYRFEVATSMAYSVDVVVREEEQCMEVASSEEPQVTFRCDGETYVMLMYGRLEPGRALTDGRLNPAGDQRLVTAFADCFIGG